MPWLQLCSMRLEVLLVLYLQATTTHADDVGRHERLGSLSALEQALRNYAPETGGYFSKVVNSWQGKRLGKWVQYFPAYHRHLRQFIGQDVNILEIGVRFGGSLEMWRAVFGERANIFGIDFDARSGRLRFDSNRTRVIIGDQTDHRLWQRVKKMMPRIDIVIDDGAHSVNAYLVTLTELLPRMSSRGVYMIEDLVGSDNPMWPMLGALWPQLQHRIKSVHLYPWLAVLEAQEGVEPLQRQLGEPKRLKAHLVPEESRNASRTMGDIRQLLHLARPKGLTTIMHTTNVGFTQHPPNSLVIVGYRDRSTALHTWGPGSGRMLWKTILRFKDLHSSMPICGDYNLQIRCSPSTTQATIQSVSIYPHFVIVWFQDEAPVPVSEILRGSEWH
eukprot:TRINITY_DN16904_c0_g1_i1.p1 TRINITY_DN16904_c0_g1~~TRINITY_DN16904_c0_g1_i1.p1  ORF type:complete len:388 (+),score=21.96 TRINITY_DN16904_c0_g1_i1:70-1233(+)